MGNRKILLVEGIDDEHVIKHLCGTRGLPKLDEIKPHEGIDRLLESFPVRLKASEHGDVVGIIVDADEQIASRWAGLRDRLIHAGYGNVPANPVVDGTIVFPPEGTILPRVGLWIMPDNQANGILEDFLRMLVPAGSSLFAHVESSVAAIPANEKRFSNVAIPKVLIHTWLAWQQEPGKPLGTSISSRFLDPTVPQVDILVSWLNRLYFQ